MTAKMEIANQDADTRFLTVVSPGSRRRLRRRVALLAALLAITVLAAPRSIPAQAVAEPPNLGKLKLQLKDYHAQDYQAALSAALKDADAWIRARAVKVRKPALVLDIDETSLSNWEEIQADDFAYIMQGDCEEPPKMPCGALAWDRSSRASALPPTLKVFQTAKELKVAVFFITGRYDDPTERAATELNLWKVGYQGWEKVIMRMDHSGTVAAYKTAARASIEAEGYAIIANIGDQESDLAGGHAEKTFKVPNPFYFIP